MKSTGIECVMREGGRIVIPEDIRIQLNINNRDVLLVYMEDEFLVLKKQVE